MTWPGVSNNDDFILTFLYTKIGPELNPQYYILNVTTSTIAKTVSPTYHSLFIEYQ